MECGRWCNIQLSERDNPFTGGLSNGLASGVGYGAGKLIELPMDKIYYPMKPWKDWIWTDVGMGISKPLPINPVPYCW